MGKRKNTRGNEAMGDDLFVVAMCVSTVNREPWNCKIPRGMTASWNEKFPRGAARCLHAVEMIILIAIWTLVAPGIIPALSVSIQGAAAPLPPPLVSLSPAASSMFLQPNSPESLTG